MMKEQVEVLDKVHRVGTHCDRLGGNEELSMQLSGGKVSWKRKQEVQGSWGKSILVVFEEYTKTSVLEQIDGKPELMGYSKYFGFYP